MLSTQLSMGLSATRNARKISDERKTTEAQNTPTAGAHSAVRHTRSLLSWPAHLHTASPSTHAVLCAFTFHSYSGCFSYCRRRARSLKARSTSWLQGASSDDSSCFHCLLSYAFIASFAAIIVPYGGCTG